uniref:Carboxypeptidase n=1 Tax=Cacopsylla melanoneura TaxID=428564 RepID=A0A8D9AGN2_9HEMI
MIERNTKISFIITTGVLLTFIITEINPLPNKISANFPSRPHSHNTREARYGPSFQDNTKTTGGAYYKLNNQQIFDIDENILGASLHLDANEDKYERHDEDLVFVSSPHFYDENENEDSWNAEDIEEEEEDDGFESRGSHNARDQDDFFGQYASDLDVKTSRQLSAGFDISGNISNHETITNNHYYQTQIKNQAHLLENLKKSHYGEKTVPQPLFLTPYAVSGNYKEGQRLAEVKPFVGNVRSYSGYLTVDKRFNSNLFFWFFPSERPDYKDRPVLLWLQGGPGGSSLFGLFFEHGPYKIVGPRIYKNEDTWSKQYNVLYLDNPVGAGFSFTTPEGYTRNQTIIGRHLYQALYQFFHLFPEFAQNDFYLTGESYAGKYIPTAAFEIHKRNLMSHFKINLKGLFIGNGMIDPISMLEYSDFLYHIGLFDEYQRDLFAKEEQKIKRFIRTKQWKRAGIKFEELFFPSKVNKTKVNFQRLTGFNQPYNLNGLDYNTKDFNHFIQDETVRDRLHVGYMKFNNGAAVNEALIRDIMKSVIQKVNVLVENYRIVFFYGGLDVICPYRVSQQFFRNIEYSHAHDYYAAERQIWTYERQDDQDNVVGFIKESHNLVEVMIRNAGHMVPRDQPRFMMDLLRKYIGS